MARSWVSDNAFAVAAITLPLLVAGLFIAATWLPRVWVPAPSYDLLFTVYGHTGDTQALVLTYAVDQGRLRVQAKYTPEHYGRYIRHLMRYRAQTGEIEDITPQLSPMLRDELLAAQTADTGSTRSIDLAPELAALELLSDPVAPDGYELNLAHNRPGVLPSLFGMDSRRTRFTISKGGRSLVIPVRPDGTDVYYYDVQFLGWVDE